MFSLEVCLEVNVRLEVRPSVRPTENVQVDKPKKLLRRFSGRIRSTMCEDC